MHLAKNEMDGRCMKISFHFQFLVLDGNQMDENYMDQLKNSFVSHSYLLSIFVTWEWGGKEHLWLIWASQNTLITSNAINWKLS